MNIIIDDLILYYGNTFEKFFWHLAINSFIQKNTKHKILIVNRTNLIRSENIIPFSLTLKSNYSNSILSLNDEIMRYGFNQKETIFIAPYPLTLPNFFSITFRPDTSLFYKFIIKENLIKNKLQIEYLNTENYCGLNLDFYHLMKQVVIEYLPKTNADNYYNQFYININTSEVSIDSNSIFSFPMLRPKVFNFEIFYGSHLKIEKKFLQPLKIKKHNLNLLDLNNCVLVQSDLNSDTPYLSLLSGISEKDLLKNPLNLLINPSQIESNFNLLISSINIFEIAISKSTHLLDKFNPNPEEIINRRTKKKFEIIHE